MQGRVGTKTIPLFNRLIYVLYHILDKLKVQIQIIITPQKRPATGPQPGGRCGGATHCQICQKVHFLPQKTLKIGLFEGGQVQKVHFLSQSGLKMGFCEGIRSKRSTFWGPTPPVKSSLATGLPCSVDFCTECKIRRSVVPCFAKSRAHILFCRPIRILLHFDSRRDKENVYICFINKFCFIHHITVYKINFTYTNIWLR